MLAKTTNTKLIILIDPDKYNSQLIEMANSCHVAYLFVGGSKLKKNNLDKTVASIKSKTTIPVIIFHGDFNHISKKADALLIPSLLSGRNADYLIGKHVLSAQKIKDSQLFTIPMGYILINGGIKSTTQKVTKTTALTSAKEIVNTAIAGELLGKQLIYLEAGSGAKKTILPTFIKKVKSHISVPLIVGGGINTVAKAKSIIASKPDYIVVGNALEVNPNLLLELNTLFVA